MKQDWRFCKIIFIIFHYYQTRRG